MADALRRAAEGTRRVSWEVFHVAATAAAAAAANACSYSCARARARAREACGSGDSGGPAADHRRGAAKSAKAVSARVKGPYSRHASPF